jgi:hypothetical protein
MSRFRPRRETASRSYHVLGKAGGHALAPRLPVQIDGGHADGPHVGMLSQPVFIMLFMAKGTDPAPGAARMNGIGPPDAQGLDHALGPSPCFDHLSLPAFFLAFQQGPGGCPKI